MMTTIQNYLPMRIKGLIDNIKKRIKENHNYLMISIKMQNRRITSYRGGYQILTVAKESVLLRPVLQIGGMCRVHWPGHIRRKIYTTGFPFPESSGTKPSILLVRVAPKAMNAK